MKTTIYNVILPEHTGRAVALPCKASQRKLDGDAPPQLPLRYAQSLITGLTSDAAHGFARGYNQAVRNLQALTLPGEVGSYVRLCHDA